MKILITYPPIENKKGIPLLSQNRQFQYSHSHTYIYPVVPASAATLLQKNAYSVSWLDAIAEKIKPSDYCQKIKKQKPDFILIESKTPVIKSHWQIINKIKSLLPKVKIILVGDHVTVLPEESFTHSQVDYILTGGNYDFLVLNLLNHLTKKEPLQKGIYYRQNNKIVNTGKFENNHDLNSLPEINRELTKWQLYAYQNGNFKNTPATYIMSARDCWWRQNGGCSFCAWTILYPNFQTRSVKNVISEIKVLVNKYHIKEIMDDSGTFPCGQFLSDFCNQIIKNKLNSKLNIDCNMRFGILSEKDYILMAKAGFRFLLFGLESANQKTLDQIGKGIKVDQVKKELKIIQKVNQKYHTHLEPHITCMIGYPWETKSQAQKTITFCKNLFQKNLLSSLQATIIIPYPGTRLFKYCKERNLLKTTNWNDYDMSKPVIKSPLSDQEIKSLIRQTYTSALSLPFIIKTLKSIHSPEDLYFIARSGLKYLARLIDFN